MAQILFLLSPVLFGGFCLLLGETIHWIKNSRHSEGLENMTVQFGGGRQ